MSIDDTALRPGQRARLPKVDSEDSPADSGAGQAGSGRDGSGPPRIVQPRLGPMGWARWFWRQLTSMRTALILLMLLALAAIPGSLIPQNRIDTSKVSTFITDHPKLAPWVDRLDGFDVYGSPWFSAIYLLLFISLIGCVAPRSRQQFRALRARPPRAPRRMERLPVHADTLTTASGQEVLAAARTALRRRRYRVYAHDEQTLSAERGLLSETGNLAFHLALVGLLAAMAVGSFISYSGQSIVVVGDTWSNTLPQYDTFAGGRAVDSDDLAPYSLTLEDFTATFDDTSTGNQFGAARDFEANVKVVEEPGADPVQETIRVNHPLDVQGSRMFLVGNGYAPQITVHDGEGNVVWSGAVPFLSTDSNYTSTGVVKMPDAQPEQLGLFAVFLPTAATDPDTGETVSVFPDDQNPELQIYAYTGDLGLDDGAAQSVYTLDQTNLSAVTDADGDQFTKTIAVGDTVTIPGGNGTVTFDGVTRYVALDVRYDPTKVYVLVFAVLALFGVTASLFVRRRRIWFRVTAAPGAPQLCAVSVGGLSRTEDTQLAAEVRTLLTSAVGDTMVDPPDAGTAAEQTPAAATEIESATKIESATEIESGTATEAEAATEAETETESNPSSAPSGGTRSDKPADGQPPAAGEGV